MKMLILASLFSLGVSYGSADTLKSTISDWGLEDLVNSALNSNLSLPPVDLERKMLASRIEQVNKQPSPMMEFMIDFLPVTFSNSGEYGLFYNQPLQLFGKTAANEEYARKSLERAEIMKTGIRYELIKAVKENYFMLFVSERLIEFNMEFQEILNGITKSLEIKYSVGKGNQYVILKSNNESQELLLEEIELKNIKRLFINNLRTLTNQELPDDLRTRNMDILLSYEIPVLDSARLAVQMNENNAEIMFLEQMMSEAILKKNIALLESYPDLNLRTGYRHIPDAGKSFLQFVIGVGLPFMPWNQRRIDALVEEKIVEEKKNEADLVSVEWNLKNKLSNQLVMLKSSREMVDLLSAVLIPQAEQTLNASLIAYETASADFMNILDSYRYYREKRQEYIKEQTTYLILITELEELIGHQILTIN